VRAPDQYLINDGLAGSNNRLLDLRLDLPNKD
jgi:hypothetical protein